MPFVIVVVHDVFICTRFGSRVTQLFAGPRLLFGIIITMRATKAAHVPLLSGLHRPRSPEALRVAQDADDLTHQRESRLALQPRQVFFRGKVVIRVR